MSSLITRRLFNRGLMFQCRTMALSSIKPDAPKSSPNPIPVKKTALYDFHVNKHGRM